MDGKPVDSASGTSAPQVSPQQKKEPAPKGRFGHYAAEARQNVKPKLPPRPKTPFQQLHGMFLPDPKDFFTFFERPLLSQSMDQVIGSVTSFNHELLEQMGFPEETSDFFNHWALTDAGFAQIEGEENENLLTEARELLDAPPGEDTYQKITLYKEGKALDITPTNKPSRRGFDKLWSFFEQLFTSPFSFLSSKKDQVEFSQTLNILTQRVHGDQPRSVSVTEPDTSIKTPKKTTQPVSLERKEELEFILNSRKQTPVYYDGELCHFQQRAGERDVLLKKPDNSEATVPVDTLYLPPSHKEATRIVNPADVELPSDAVIDPAREKELLYICAYIEKDDEVLHKGQPCKVTDVSILETSPQVMLKTADGRDIYAALHHIQLPPESEELPTLPEEE